MFESFLQQLQRNTTILTLRYFILSGISFLLFYFIFKKFFHKHKIQSKYPSKHENGREIFYSVITSLVFALVFTIVTTYLQPYTLIYKSGEYSMIPVWLSYILMILIHDTYFYWTHRLIHKKVLFRKVHLIHHKSTNPSPWTSYAFHPYEALIQAMIIPIIAFTIPVQKSAFILYFILQFLHNIYGHLGYELFPKFITNTTLGKLLNTSTYHNKHHSNFHGNYGLYFTIWDRIMKTNKD